MMPQELVWRPARSVPLGLGFVAAFVLAGCLGGAPPATDVAAAARSEALSGQTSSTIGAAESPADNTSTSPAAPSESAHRLHIVATTGIVADMVRTIAGPDADVESLMASGVDPHLYKPTTNDISRILKSDIVFINGLHLEGRMQDALEKAGKRGRQVVAVAEHLPADRLRKSPAAPELPDPHVWMDVGLWSQCTTAVAATLAAKDPVHAGGYTSRADELRGDLAKLDAAVREMIATIPRAQRQLVTAHDAFGYFSRAYDIPVHSVQGISTDSEPGVEDVRALVEVLVQTGAPAVFVESTVNPQSLRAVVEAVESRGGHVRIGGELFSDALGREGTYEGTYVGMIDHNATTMTRALGGTAPHRGLSGKLSAPIASMAPAAERPFEWRFEPRRVAERARQVVTSRAPAEIATTRRTLAGAIWR